MDKVAQNNITNTQKKVKGCRFYMAISNVTQFSSIFDEFSG